MLSLVTWEMGRVEKAQKKCLVGGLEEWIDGISTIKCLVGREEARYIKTSIGVCYENRSICAKRAGCVGTVVNS